jgi:sigma-B regulation protein RsbU (phosphoserine phosphatase)
MLLRTRITLIVALGFVLLVAVLGLGSYLSDRQDEKRFSEIATLAQSALWDEIVRGATADLVDEHGRLSASDAFRNAALGRDRTAATAALAAEDVAIDQNGGEIVAVIGANRDPLMVVGSLGKDQIATQALLDAGTLDRVIAGSRINGLRQVSANEVIILAAGPLNLPGGGRAALLLARGAQGPLQRFADQTGSAATLVTLRGRVVASTDSELWQRAGITLAPRSPTVEQVDLGERLYSLVSVPITDITGGVTGAVASLRDMTDTLSVSRFISQAALVGAAGLSLIGIIGLNLYLWRGFRPLEGAINAMRALARGDLSARLEGGGRRDEIGRIADAIDTFRGNAQALADSRTQRERIRRRQESVIRTELEGLAASLDSVGREGVLSLLSDLSAGEAPQEDPLRRLAGVMRDLSRRIVDQHQTLSSMVHELREALVTKTKLAGLQQELEIARQVQLAILPRDVPRDTRIEVNGLMTPAREVGGDFFDYFMVDRNTMGFVIADVSGKGVPAALFMAISRTLLKSTALFEASPALCMRRINDVLAAENDQMLFVTMLYGIVDLASGRVTYVNAGHNPPYRVTKDGEITLVPPTGGMAVAVVEDFPYVERELHLAPGETLFLFTDGVTEAFDPDDVAYGENRLIEILATSCGADHPIGAAAEAVVTSVRAFEQGLPPADDLTCLAVRYRGAA